MSNQAPAVTGWRCAPFPRDMHRISLDRWIECQ
jgi:hypothetical protein